MKFRRIRTDQEPFLTGEPDKFFALSFGQKKLLCKVFGHSLYSGTSDVSAEAICKRCGHVEPKIEWPKKINEEAQTWARIAGENQGQINILTDKNNKLEITIDTLKNRIKQLEDRIEEYRLEGV